MGKHRRRHRAPRRAPGRITLVSAGLVVPLMGGAAVFAATAHTDGLAAHSSSSRDGHSAARGTSQLAPVPQSRPNSSTAHTASPKPATSAPAAGPKLGFSPYADVLAWPRLDLLKTSDDTHVKDFTMGFVAADGGCTAAWGGLSALSDPLALHRIKKVPGKLTVSFGGPHGSELAQTCTGVDDLAAQYQDVIDATKPDGIDFFLDDDALADGAATQRRTQALARVQDDNKDVKVSITLPLHRSGLSDSALGVLRSASAAGLDVSIVNLIPADGGGQSLTASATVAHGQLQSLYHEGDAQTWGRMGITPVIGVADGLEFGPGDAQTLLSWAQTHGLARMSMWSITRDAPCTLETTVANDTCSGLDEDTGVFSKILGRF